MEKKRAFIALNIGSAARTRLSELQHQLKPAKADVRWVAPQNLHLTLAFLGNVDTQKFQTLENELRKQFQPLEPFELTIRGTGIFGQRSRPSVVWAGIDECKKLVDLRKRTVEAVHISGIPYTETSFRPHLTLGRFKSLKNQESLFQSLEKEKETIFQTLEVDSVEIIQSELKPGGAIYSVISRTTLSKG